MSVCSIIFVGSVKCSGKISLIIFLRLIYMETTEEIVLDLGFPFPPPDSGDGAGLSLGQLRGYGVDAAPRGFTGMARSADPAKIGVVEADEAASLRSKLSGVHPAVGGATNDKTVASVVTDFLAEMAGIETMGQTLADLNPDEKLAVWQLIDECGDEREFNIKFSELLFSNAAGALISALGKLLPRGRKVRILNPAKKWEVGNCDLGDPIDPIPWVGLAEEEVILKDARMEPPAREILTVSLHEIFWINLARSIDE